MTMQGEDLKRLRERANLTQGQMAEAMGLSPTFIGLMERDEKPIERRTELAALFIARLNRDAASMLRAELVDIGWLPLGDGWLGQIGPFNAQLSPESKGRWSINLTQRAKPHYSPPWPRWEATLDAAKAAALMNAKHGMADLLDLAADQ